jgi:hypothetical protein
MLERAMMEPNQLLCPQRNHGIGAPLIVAELNLGHRWGEQLDYGSNLAANEPMFRHILEYGNFGKKFHLTPPPHLKEYSK